MKKALDILRCKLDGQLTNRESAMACQVSPATVSGVLGRFEASKLPWPLPADIEESEVERRLFYQDDTTASTVEEADKPDFAWIQAELRKKHVTLKLLWEEYKTAHPKGFHYSYFCEQYGAWRNQLEPVMRQTHEFGHKCFVDYAGDTVPIVDPETGEVRQAQIFVAVLGASNYTYAEAVWSQEIPNWLTSHVRMLNYFQGATRVLVPDNLRSGVSKADRYEPEIHPAYARLADHYKMVIIPARVRRPKDKAKVEGGVLISERWILAALRNIRFFCINELNDNIGKLLDKLNRTPFQKLEGSRHTVFESQERPVLLPLPVEPFVQRDFQRMRVPDDYYLDVDGHLYMVPYRLIDEVVEVWTTTTIVEVCHRNQRVALHARSDKRGGRTAVTEFMPVAHREVSSWTTERMIAWANKIGPQTTRVIEAVVAASPHPEMAVNSCLGILRQAKKRGSEALEAACRRAMAIKSPTYRSVKSILENNLHQQPLPASEPPPKRPRKEHENLRGQGYYQMSFGEEDSAC